MGGVHVGHHVHVPDPLPVVDGELLPARDRNAGIRDEEVDRAHLGLHLANEPDQLLAPRHVDTTRDATEALRDPGGRCPVEIDHRDPTRPFRGEALAQGTPDAIAAPGHHDVLSRQLHRPAP
jgi:hypothetical protein